MKQDTFTVRPDPHNEVHLVCPSLFLLRGKSRIPLDRACVPAYRKGTCERLLLDKRLALSSFEEASVAYMGEQVEVLLDLHTRECVIIPKNLLQQPYSVQRYRPFFSWYATPRVPGGNVLAYFTTNVPETWAFYEAAAWPQDLIRNMLRRDGFARNLFKLVNYA